MEIQWICQLTEFSCIRLNFDKIYTENYNFPRPKSMSYAEPHCRSYRTDLGPSEWGCDGVRDEVATALVKSVTQLLFFSLSFAS